MLRLDETPVRLHFGIPEELYALGDSEVPFLHYLRHYVPYAGKNGKGMYVECGPECVVCAYTTPQTFGLENVEVNAKLAKSEARPYYAVAGWVEEWFHRVEYWRDDNDHSKGTYHSKERCQGKGCEFCKAELEKVFGNKFYLILPPMLWNTLIQLQDEAELTCECDSRIYVPHYQCPACENVLVDVVETCENCEGTEIALDADTLEAECTACNHTWSADIRRNENILKEVEREHLCTSCQNNVFPSRTYQCVNPDCGTSPRSIFQMQLTLKQTGKGKDGVLHILDWKFQDPDARLFDPQYQGDNSGEEKWADKIAEGNKKVINLSEYLSPEEPEQQIKALAMNLDNPFMSGQGGQTYHRPRRSQD
jgi:hypothetical protein